LRRVGFRPLKKSFPYAHRRRSVVRWCGALRSRESSREGTYFFGEWGRELR
jgi:hypothetical protein